MQNWIQSDSPVTVPSPGSEAHKHTIWRLWELIKSEADRLGMGGNLPANWMKMCETPGS
jgi:hypothetical protein